MKKRTKLLFGINYLSFLTLFLFSNLGAINAQNYCNSNPVNVHGDLSVNGNRIVDQNNNPVSFAGNSMFWSNTGWGAEKYYNANIVSWLKEDWGTTIIRAAMGVEDSGGYLSDITANKNRVKTIVDAAIAEGLYVIIDWHSHGAENYEQEAIEFFKEMASLYGNTPNVIYEIYNEPIYSSWSNDIKPYAESVISAIRAIDSNNLIIVGSPTWSQDVDVASNDPITSSTNIAYTLHFYAGTHGASLRAKAQTALNNGIALMATEWGTVNANGDGSVDYNSTDEWMAFLQENHISHLNWSVNEKEEGASILQTNASENGNWSNSNLTESGIEVKSIIEGWTQYCDDDTTIIVTPPSTYVSIPAKIEAEDFDDATEGRTQTIDNVTNVGWIDSDEYLSYNINVPSAGDYSIDFRLASLSEGAKFNVYQNNSLVGNISSSATGGWQVWETTSTTVNLSSGNSVLKIVATGSSWNIDWMEFNEEGEDEGTTTGCNNIQIWNMNTVYSEAGTQVVYDNNIYENNWYSRNENPETNSGQHSVWSLVGSCSSASAKSTLFENDLFEVTAFPNPYTESITINTKNSNQEIDSIKLINLSGEVIIQKTMNEDEAILDNLEKFANGFYLLQVINSNEQIIKTIKIIKK